MEIMKYVMAITVIGVCAWAFVAFRNYMNKLEDEPKDPPSGTV